MSDSLDMLPADPLPLPDDELAAEFKAVLVEGKRRGFRLERLYWRLLDDMSARVGLRRSALIATILDRKGLNAANAASALRGYVARTLEDERNQLTGVLAQSNMIRLLQQAPLPAFAVNRQKQLQQVNSEFNQLVRVTVGNMRQNVTTDKLQLTFDARIEDLIAEAEARGWAVCTYNIVLGERGRRGRTKLVAVPPHPSDVLVGYVVN